MRSRSHHRVPSGKLGGQLLASVAMFKYIVLMLSVVVAMNASELPSKKYLNLAAIKTMVAAAEAEAQRQNVQVTICVVDESGKLAFPGEGRQRTFEHYHLGTEKGTARGVLQKPIEGCGGHNKKRKCRGPGVPRFLSQSGRLADHC
jgi:hypothetical protein